ncbi:MAG TPA: DUF1573 domain-containing protein [Cyclobacteriaceae bacterium]
MRTPIFILALIISSAAFGQGAQISWDKSNFDFGDIRQGEKVEYTFKFHNTGSQPLMITNVTTQCGCTAPKGWPRDPIQPGDRGEITLVFDSTGKFGRVNKMATVMSNAVNKDGTQVLLSGNVVEKLANP